MKWKQAKLGLAVGTIYAMLAVYGTSTNPSGSLTLTPSNPNQSWPCSLSRYETGTLTITIVYEGWANNRLYRFTSSSFPQLSEQGDSFVWVGSGSGLSGSYHITNTRGEKVDDVTVTASCRWDPVGSGGGGGGQDTHIDGHGTGIADALGYYWNEANEHVKPVGESETVYAWYGVGVPSPSSWTNLSGPMTVTDYDTEADVHGTGISGSENDAVVKSVSDATGDSDTESFTFVGVDSLKYRIGSGGSWTVMPNPLVVSNGTAVEFKATDAPSGTPWPSEKPVWSGASGSGDEASQTFTSPGTNLVTVECGNVVTGIVLVIRVEIENTAPRDTDDIQVQYFTNSAGTFTYTAIPLQVYYRLQPDSGWTPDSVEMHIKNPGGSTIRTIALPTTVGQQQTTWDGKDSGGNYVANGSNYVVEIAATIGGTTCTATNGLTIYEIRQGDCVYRPIAINEHAAILYEYLGGNRLTDVQNNNLYTVMEHPGTGGTTGPSNYGNFNDWIGAFCPPGLSRTQRKAILEKAHELDDANIPYVSFPYLDALTHNDAAGSPAGTDWAGTVGDILRIRCDGTVEVACEDVGERLYGGDAWWDIMTPGAGTGSNLALHNDGTDSMNPNRQRDGINAAHDLTRNRADAIHLP